jgi:membrane protein CcdC involved in cytochrome C biogenesis
MSVGAIYLLLFAISQRETTVPKIDEWDLPYSGGSIAFAFPYLGKVKDRLILAAFVAGSIFSVTLLATALFWK